MDKMNSEIREELSKLGKAYVVKWLDLKNAEHIATFDGLVEVAKKMNPDCAPSFSESARYEFIVRGCNDIAELIKKYYPYANKYDAKESGLYCINGIYHVIISTEKCPSYTSTDLIVMRCNCDCIEYELITERAENGVLDKWRVRRA